MHDAVGRDYQEEGDSHTKESGQEADDAGLGIEDVGDVPLGCSHGAENPDLLGPFQDRDVGDDADHD